MPPHDVTTREMSPSPCALHAQHVLLKDKLVNGPNSCQVNRSLCSCSCSRACAALGLL